MSGRPSLLPLLALVWLFTSSALANGRMPGANELVFSAGDPARLVARATFGIVHSDDHGATWSWICEQAIDVSGVIADPPLAMSQDGSLVLLPPTGSALVSSDRGCNWGRVGAPLAATRGADLTLDPSDPKRVLVVTSTLRMVDDAGFGSYENLVVETRDDARSWQLLASLPTDFEAETIEVARSDPRRLYVSGSDARDGRLGVLLRSEDAGLTWSKSTLALPPGTGSLWISGIHPRDPDRLWVRVAARGDTIGLLPARLYLSTDKGATFTMLASTTKGMFGFALSPDGGSLAYGGPSDGLYVGPSDGSAFVKRSTLGVRCLRWRDDDALYVCASEPSDPFSVGVSSDRGVSFRALYRLAATCPAACASGTSFADSCQAAWSQTRPFIAASGAQCSVPWSAAPALSADAGPVVSAPPPDTARPDDAGGASLTRDASATREDAAAAPARADAGSGCACQIGAARAGKHDASGAWLLLGALALLRRQRQRSSTLGSRAHGPTRLPRWQEGSPSSSRAAALRLCWLLLGGCAGEDAPAQPMQGALPADAGEGTIEDDGFVGCPDSIPGFAPGMRASGERAVLGATLVEASNVPPRRYLNDWTLALTRADGGSLADIVLTKARAFMPVHGHDGIVPPTLSPAAEPGRVHVRGLNLNMRGPWEVQLSLSSPSAGDDYAVFHICVQE